MKSLRIETVIEGSKLATAIKTTGYSNESISDQLEMLGLMDNAKSIIQERIKVLLNLNK